MSNPTGLSKLKYHHVAPSRTLDEQPWLYPNLFGAVVGILVALPLLSTLASLWVRGWSPVGDNAVIALRSFDVFSGHGPMLGHINQAGAGKVFDPGPLENWLLALPVRLFPSGAGAILGATIVETAAVVAALIAIARTVGRWIAIVVATAGLVLCWSAAIAIVDPVWNPHVGLLPFFAVLVLAWAVAAGALDWWPVLVFFASFCVQSHLMYGPASLGLVIAAPVLAMALPPTRGLRRLRPGWLLTGFGVALASWIAPIWQQFTGSPGNLSLLWRSTIHASAPTLGWDVAWNQFARAVEPPTVWFHSRTVGETPVSLLATHGRAAFGIVAVVLLLLLLFIAIWLGGREVAALTAVAAIADVGAVAVIASLPKAHGLAIAYVQWVIWPCGMMTWLALIWGPIHLWRERRVQWRRSRWHWTPAAITGLTLTAMGLAVLFGLRTTRWTPRDSTSTLRDGKTAQQISNLVVRSDLRQGRLSIASIPNPGLLAAIVYQLAVTGSRWHPTVRAFSNQLTGYYRPRQTDRVLELVAVGARPMHPSRVLGEVSVEHVDGTTHQYRVVVVAPQRPPGP